MDGKFGETWAILQLYVTCQSFFKLRALLYSLIKAAVMAYGPLDLQCLVHSKHH